MSIPSNLRSGDLIISHNNFTNESFQSLLLRQGCTQLGGAWFVRWGVEISSVNAALCPGWQMQEVSAEDCQMFLLET